ncbi:MAG TPA: CPBP family intramembrane glutamic endopeptidase [Candidatus Acidoferrum sp.]|nr:CPBP family intramembrane glutamic endopeptidase [Candidatus Acidoferrum sp.]
MPVPAIFFFLVCLFSEAILFVYNRADAYAALGAFAYGLVLWLITRACIRSSPAAEESTLKAQATGLRLYARIAVVVASLLFVALRANTGFFLVWRGDTAFTAFISEALIPGLLLFALGAKPIELGLGKWAKGSWFALLGALVFPTIMAALWFTKGHASVGLLIFMLARNFLGPGISEEFLMRGMTMSHLRAFFSNGWAVAVQALLFGVLHFQTGGNALLTLADVIALNAPMGFFLGLIALRARSVVLTGLIHTTLDTLKDIVM